MLVLTHAATRVETKGELRLVERAAEKLDLKELIGLSEHQLHIPET